MKRILLILLFLTLTVMLIGCSGGRKSDYNRASVDFGSTRTVYEIVAYEYDDEYIILYTNYNTVVKAHITNVTLLRVPTND